MASNDTFPLEQEQRQQGGTSQETNGKHSLMTNEEDPSLLVRYEEVRGSRPGDVRARRVIPAHPKLRRVERGVLEATTAADAPQTGWERTTTALKRALIGTPLSTARLEHERLTKFKALAVLSSDVISSVAYATEAILLTLVVAGSGNLWVTLFICFAIVALLSIVTLSYRQTIPAYPNGGGSYIVAHDNLGLLPGLIAAASLMIDYVLTVSVSIAAGVQAIATLWPALTPYVVLFDVALVVLITVVNLRGVRESATIFALPTYLFVFSALLLIIVGSFKVFLFEHHSLFGNFPHSAATEPLTLFLILRSFSAGCTALTGTEAISNGVPAFKKPEARNASITLTLMALIIGTLFVGTTILALGYGTPAYADGNPTVIGQIAQRVFTGPLLFMYPVFQIATLFILTLAANTSYSDFPRLSSLLARDHFLPHQFAFRGDRLAFSTGIISLAILAIVLLIAFNGLTTALINLYAVGVFFSFTLSQAGMVRHWWRLRASHRGWLRSMLINGLGATATLAVALVISATKFFEGAWIVVLLIPLLVLMFLLIRHHYLRVERERTTAVPLRAADVRHRLIVPLGRLDQATQQSLAYARSISAEVTAIHVNLDPAHTIALRTDWENWQATLARDEQVPLKIIEPQQRSLVRCLRDCLTAEQQQHPGETLTVILPEIAEHSALKRLLAHPRTFLLKWALFYHPEIVVTNVFWDGQKSTSPLRPCAIRHRFIVPIAELDRPSVQSLAYARSITSAVVAAHVALDQKDAEVIREKWKHLQGAFSPEDETKLVIIESPYRSLIRPLLAYIDAIQEIHPDETLTVILPEFVVAHFWEYLLHNQTAWRLKTALLARPGIVVTDISQHL
ncbi:MAG TPA: APC family permease [Ktedonosporobacter sp.]|jgi:amino acid transporter|nr:APC family permease [Ktedonosporobacter sp.]